ncbi:unnamed protein product, partial [Iphiclides podalirius]
MDAGGSELCFKAVRCEDGGGGAATGTGGRAASLRLANGRVAAQSAEQLPHSPADCASVRISIDNTNTCCTDSLVTALDDETLLLGTTVEPLTLTMVAGRVQRRSETRMARLQPATNAPTEQSQTAQPRALTYCGPVSSS